MKIIQRIYSLNQEVNDLSFPFEPDVFFIFVSPDFLNTQKITKDLIAKYPNTHFIGCSTAGEIAGRKLLDATMVVNALSFEKGRIKRACISLEDHNMSSHEVGARLSEELNSDDLNHLFLLSAGLEINGEELVASLSTQLPNNVGITGGLAAAGPDFGDTFIITNEGILYKCAVALGFYGDGVKISHGSNGGWDSFGVERLVTKSQGKVLYEIDGQPALDLYKSYLGDKANDLPSSGLLFPLSVRNTYNQNPVVRTILGIDEEAKSLIFTAHIPENSYVRLMKANVDRLIDGAKQSAKQTINETEVVSAEFALLISCFGRRLVLKQLSEEELDAVNEVLGENVISSGFYSYGELAPFKRFAPCSLHNQTMTITTFSE